MLSEAAKIRELPFFFLPFGLNRKNFAFVRTVPVYLQFLLWVQYVCTDILCLGGAAQKANQKSSTSDTEISQSAQMFHSASGAFG